VAQQSARFNRVSEAIEQFSALADVFERRRETLARGAALTVEQWRTLEAVASEHFMPSMFARGRKSSPAAVSKILRQLLEARMVAVAVASGDLRKRSYRLTARGRRTLDNLRTARRDAIDAIWMRLPERDVETFSRFAQQLVASIEEYELRSVARSVG
jgi:DNA-binding MarR family transcriptional regulator